jgi:hypothetical protein
MTKQAAEFEKNYFQSQKLGKCKPNFSETPCIPIFCCLYIGSLNWSQMAALSLLLRFLVPKVITDFRYRNK